MPLAQKNVSMHNFFKGLELQQGFENLIVKMPNEQQETNK